MLNKHLAGVYFRNKDYKKAIPFYKAVQKVKYNITNDFYIGECYFNLKKYDQALKYYNRIPAKNRMSKTVEERKALIKEQQFFENK